MTMDTHARHRLEQIDAELVDLEANPPAVKPYDARHEYGSPGHLEHDRDRSDYELPEHHWREAIERGEDAVVTAARAHHHVKMNRLKVERKFIQQTHGAADE